MVGQEKPENQGQIVINYSIKDGQLRLELHAPLASQGAKELTVKVLANAIPNALNYQDTIIKPAGANGKLPPITPAVVK